MRRICGVLCTITVVLAATACGGSATTPAGSTTSPRAATSTGAATSGSGTASGSGTTPGSGTTSTGRGQPPVFPVTITRTGGIAGFQDVVVVGGDGVVSITRKGQKPRRCRLTPGALEQLKTASSRVPWSRVTPASTQPSFPDDMVTTAQSPAGGPVRLPDPQAGDEGQVFLALLNDLSGTTAASRLCVPH